jgi:hypothetical protein
MLFLMHAGLGVSWIEGSFQFNTSFILGSRFEFAVITGAVVEHVF